MLRGVFYTSHPCIFIGVGWRLDFYSLGVSIQIIIVSISIQNLILAFLGRVDLIWVFLSLNPWGSHQFIL